MSGEPERATRQRLFVFDPEPRAFATGYSLFVRGMKLLLPATAVALIVLVFVWPQLFPKLDLIAGMFRVTAEDLQSLQVVRARFVGTDSEGRPYTVTAERASQTSATAKSVLLTKPHADITLADGTWLALSANHGTFYRETQQLALSGEVVLYHDQGYELSTASVDIDIKAGTAESGDPVMAHGPLGILTGSGFRVEERGARIFLKGPASLTMHGDAKKAGG